jgi:hypothetical protein
MDGGQPHKTVIEANVVVNNKNMQRNANYYWKTKKRDIILTPFNNNYHL